MFQEFPDGMGSAGRTEAGLLEGEMAQCVGEAEVCVAALEQIGKLLAKGRLGIGRSLSGWHAFRLAPGVDGVNGVGCSRTMGAS
jgi:hypothetical protein